MIFSTTRGSGFGLSRETGRTQLKRVAAGRRLERESEKRRKQGATVAARIFAGPGASGTAAGRRGRAGSGVLETIMALSSGGTHAHFKF